MTLQALSQWVTEVLISRRRLSTDCVFDCILQHLEQAVKAKPYLKVTSDKLVRRLWILMMTLRKVRIHVILLPELVVTVDWKTVNLNLYKQRCLLQFVFIIAFPTDILHFLSCC